jgi:hypothetical protein
VEKIRIAILEKIINAEYKIQIIKYFLLAKLNVQLPDKIQETIPQVTPREIITFNNINVLLSKSCLFFKVRI